MNRVLGILGLLAAIVFAMVLAEPRFYSEANLENLIRRTALYGILSIGVAFPIITAGIDLSIGSVVGLVGAMLPWLLVQHDWSVGAALAAVLLVGAAIGCGHGFLVTKLRLQPFVVTLCGLLIYRGLARWMTDDRTQGFGSAFEGLRTLATGKPCSLALVVAVLGALGVAGALLRWRRARLEGEAVPGTARAGALMSGAVSSIGVAAMVGDLGVLSTLRAPAPFLFLIVLGLAAGGFLTYTVWGRHMLALGRNERAARYSGIATGRLVVLAYVLCALCAALGGVLFALDVNSVAPAMQGNFFELYAIAAAVLGGCSLRGGEGSILGVIAGAAVMRTLYNAINLLRLPDQLEFTIVGVVLLAGVATDEVLKRWVAARRRWRDPGAPSD